MHYDERTTTYLWQRASCETGRQERTRRSNSSLRRERWSLDEGRMRFESMSTSKPAEAALLFTIASGREHREVKPFQERRENQLDGRTLMESSHAMSGLNLCEVELRASKAAEVAAASLFEAGINLRDFETPSRRVHQPAASVQTRGPSTHQLYSDAIRRHGMQCYDV
jgi:hypothetical protein